MLAVSLGAKIYIKVHQWVPRSSIWSCVLSGGGPTPAGTSVFTKPYLEYGNLGIYGLMGGAFIS